MYYYDKILSQLEQLFDYGVIFLFLFVFQVIALVFNVEFISKTRIKSKMQCSMRMKRLFVLSYNTLSMNEEVTWVTFTGLRKNVFLRKMCVYTHLWSGSANFLVRRRLILRIWISRRCSEQTGLLVGVVALGGTEA